MLFWRGKSELIPCGLGHAHAERIRMSIARLKKQSKNLFRLLPEHIKKHPGGGPLSACQELIARTEGLPSWHVAMSRHESASPPVKPRLLSTLILRDLMALQLRVDALHKDWHGRVITLVRIVYAIQVDLERQGKSLSEKLTYELSELEAIHDQGDAEDPNTIALGRYLQTIPGYGFPYEREGLAISKHALEQHDLVLEAIDRLEKKETAKKKSEKKDSLATQYDHFPPRSLESLGVPLGIQKMFFPMEGLVLIAGKTGQGKTTLMASILAELKKRKKDPSIIDYKSPLEHSFEFFPSKKDGVLLVGDLNNQKLIESVVCSVLSGQLVYAEKNAASAVDAILRVLKTFPLDERNEKGRVFLSALSLVAWKKIDHMEDGSIKSTLEIFPMTDDLRKKMLALDLIDTAVVEETLANAFEKNV